MRARNAGFTLLEVLLAVAIVGIVYGFLLQFVASNISDVGEARRAAELSGLAEQRLREIEAEAASGEPLADGTEDGTFEEPHEDVRWQVTVEPWQLPLPEGFAGVESPSPIFQLNEGRQLEPVVRKVDLRVFEEARDPQQATPFVIFVVTPDAPADEGDQG